MNDKKRMLQMDSSDLTARVDWANLWQSGVRAIFFYDGVCGLCHHAVRFWMKRDVNRRIRYAPVQGAVYRAIFGTKPAGAMVVIQITERGCGRVLDKSDAILELMRLLPFPWSMGGIVGVIPRLVRDLFYRGLAAGRYRLFGKYLTCSIPERAEKELFLP